MSDFLDMLLTEIRAMYQTVVAISIFPGPRGGGPQFVRIALFIIIPIQLFINSEANN